MRLRQSKSKIPVLKKFWQRAAFYLILGIFFGLLIYWLLSLYSPEVLSQPGPGSGRRTEAIRLALNLMSPSSWGWFWFILMIVGGFGGDWYYHRFKDLPAERLNSE